MSMLSLLSSRFMIAVFLASSICCGSSERPGHNVLTFQLASHKIFSFLFLLSLPGAGFTVCFSVYSLSSNEPSLPFFDLGQGLTSKNVDVNHSSDVCHIGESS